MQLPVLFQRPLEMMLNVHRNLGIAILVQQQKPGIAVDDPFLGSHFTSGHNVLQCLEHIICHRNESASAFGFRLFYIVGAVRLADKLVMVLYPLPSFCSFISHSFASEILISLIFRYPKSSFFTRLYTKLYPTLVAFRTPCFQRGCVNCTPFSCHILITVLISQVFALALSRPKDSPFYLFFFRTLSNSFPQWRGMNLTKSFYHIHASNSTIKYIFSYMEYACSGYCSNRRHLISRLVPTYSTNLHCSSSISSRSLFIPIPK